MQKDLGPICLRVLMSYRIWDRTGEDCDADTFFKTMDEFEKQIGENLGFIIDTEVRKAIDEN